MRLRPRATPAAIKWADASLTPQQEQTLRLVAETFRATGQWPKWSSLRRRIGLSGAAADTMLKDMPRAGTLSPLGQSYGFIRVAEGLNGPLSDEAAIQLTVAGLWRAGARDLVAGYLQLLQDAVTKSRSLDPELTTSAVVQFTGSDAANLGQPASLFADPQMYLILTFEPPFWAARNRSPGDSGGFWSFGLSDAIERYAPATTIETYLDVVDAQIQEANADHWSQTATTPSPKPAGPWWKTLPARGLTFVLQRSQIALTALFDRALFFLFGAAAVILLGWLGWAPWLKHLHC